MKILIIFGVIAVVFAREQCERNEHYNSCGYFCPVSCDNMDHQPQPCILMCRPGCHCDAGYVRNAQNQCVRPEECPTKDAKCGVNEHYNSCGTACPTTCDNKDDGPRPCILICNPGCHCDAGYVRNAQKECIRPEECPTKAETHRPRQTSSEVCNLPAETGVCRGNFRRFHFNRATGQCQRFVYGGCGGNGNNFQSIAECQRSCGASGRKSSDVCELEKVVGPCRAAFRRFFYNKATGQCERFIYGGCRGNANNFLTRDECRYICEA